MATNPYLARAQSLQDDSWKKKDEAKNSLQLAPLTQAISADRQKLTAFLNPDGTVNKDHADEYKATVDGMAEKMGRLRTMMGAPEPHPDHFGAEIGGLSDRVHILRDLAHRFQSSREKSQNQKRDQWNAQNTQTAQDTAAGTLPFAMTPEGQEETRKSADALKLAEARQKSNYVNFRNPDNGQTVAVDITKQEPPAGWVRAGNDLQNADTRMRDDFKNDPNKQPGETFEGWKARLTKGAPKVGSLGEFLTAAYGPRPTPQQEIQGRQRWAEAIAGTTTGEHTIMVPQPDGSIKAFIVQTSSTKNVGGGGAGLPSTRQDEPGATPDATPKAAPKTPGPKAKAVHDVSAAHRNGAVQSGDTVGGRMTGPQNKAMSDYAEAVKLSSTADQVAAHPDDAINQKRLAVALEKASAGRFTVQALDYIIKAGWGNTIEQWANNPRTGALPKDVMRQLVDGAHQNLQSSKDSMKALNVPIPGQSGPSGGIKITRDAQGRITGIE